MKPYFIVSDLHMGDGSASDDFRAHKGLFLEFLEYVKDHEGTLFLAGDVFELWQADLQSILQRNSEVVQKLFDVQPKIIVGNHDYYLKGFIDFEFIYYPALSIPTDRGVVRVEHGHEHDSNNDPDRNMQLGKIVASLGGYGERWIHPDIDESFMSFVGLAKTAANKVWDDINTPWKREKRSGRAQSNNTYIRAAEKLIQEDGGLSWVVFGHTHNAVLKEDKHYVNAGCWVKEIPTFVKIENNVIGLYEFRGRDDIQEKGRADL